jgi:hypothetical protein
MSPFQEATYEQLGRLLKIIDHFKDNPEGLSWDFFLNWADGKPDATLFSTQQTIEHWEWRMTNQEEIDDWMNKT